MTDRPDVLRDVMRQTGTTQSELSRLSGVRQPSISQYLSRRVEMSDEMLERLLSCMGYQLEVRRRPIAPTLNRSSERSWRLHRQLSTHFNHEVLEDWLPTIDRNLKRLRGGTQGQPHERNLTRWERLLHERDVSGIRKTLTGLDTHSIEMREVSPFGGLLPEHERAQVLASTR